MDSGKHCKWTEKYSEKSRVKVKIDTIKEIQVRVVKTNLKR